MGYRKYSCNTFRLVYKLEELVYPKIKTINVILLSDTCFDIFNL
jgi:hypothetical protein